MNSPVGGAAHPTEVARKTGIALAGRIGYSILSYVSLLLAARMLGATDFGIYTIGLSLVGFLSTVGAMGTDNSLLRVVPKRLADGDVAGARAALRTATWLTLAAGSLAALALFALQAALVDHFGPGGRALPLIGLAIPLASFLYVPRAAGQAVHAIRLVVANGFLLQAGSLVVGMAVALTADRRSPMLAAGLYAASWAVASLMLTLGVGRRREFGYRWLWPWGEYDAEVRGLSPRFLLLQLTVNLKSSLIVFILGIVLPPAEVGLYGAALRTATLVSFILTGINVAFVPIISELWARGSVDEIHRLYRTTARWALAVSLPVCLVLILVPGAILGGFDASFAAGGAVLVWLACGQLINAATGSVGYLLMMSGREQVVTMNSVMATVLSGTATWFVARSYGVIGAAVVGGVVVSLFNLGLLWAVWRELRMVPFDAQTLRVLPAGIVGVGVGLTVRTMVGGDQLPPSIAAITTCAAALFAYAACFLALNRRAEDWALLRGLLSRRRGAGG